MSEYFPYIATSKFEPDENSHLAFPCCSCKHRHGTDKEEPCASCGHNLNAIILAPVNCSPDEWADAVSNLATDPIFETPIIDEIAPLARVQCLHREVK